MRRDALVLPKLSLQRLQAERSIEIRFSANPEAARVRMDILIDLAEKEADAAYAGIEKACKGVDLSPTATPRPR